MGIETTAYNRQEYLRRRIRTTFMKLLETTTYDCYPVYLLQSSGATAVLTLLICVTAQYRGILEERAPLRELNPLSKVL